MRLRNILSVGLIAVVMFASGFGVGWLRFHEASEAQPDPAVVSGIDPKKIEKLDFKKYIASIYENETGDPLTDPELRECPPGSTSAVEARYADLTGDGIEEAVVRYYTCLNGTGGGNSEVYSLDYAGKPMQLAVKNDDPAVLSSYGGREKVWEGSGGHGYYDIDEKGRLILVFPVYKGGDPNCCPTGGLKTISYSWERDGFAISGITIKPPEVIEE